MMIRRIIIVACLSIAVLVVGIMAFVEPRAPQYEAGNLKWDETLFYTPAVATAQPALAAPAPRAETPEASVTLEPTAVPEAPVTPGVSATPEVRATPEKPPETPTPSPVAARTPAAEPTPRPEARPPISGKPLSGRVIGVDPGHQLHSNSDLEPVAPGSSEMKKKVSSGTQGRFTRVPEHTVNLNVGLLLRDMLREAGATVVMIREEADVNISNAERAQIFNDKKVALGVRIHCNGSNDAGVTGAFMLIPKSNPFKEECELAAGLILSAYGKETGVGIKRGITVRSDQTGFNWCERPIVNIEMGHMTNEEEDRKLSDADFQVKMARGIYEGIAAYFAQS